jgi:hypothetical protein
MKKSMTQIKKFLSGAYNTKAFGSALPLILCLIIGSSDFLIAQCPAGQIELTVTYDPSFFPEDNGWILWDADANAEVDCYASGNNSSSTYSADHCVVEGTNLELRAWDNFGDGWDGAVFSIDCETTNLYSAIIDSEVSGNGSISCPNASLPAGGVLLWSGAAPIGGCPAVSCDIAITGTSSTPETCDMDNDGSITITATSSNPPINYAISGPVSANNATGVFTGLPAGNYGITVTDAVGGTCEATTNETVGGGSDVMITGTSSTPETCGMGNDGSITISATSSNPPINYAISGPVSANNATGVFTGLPPGNYNITVTDAVVGTCEGTATEMVAANMGTCPTVSRTSANDPTSFDPCSCGDPLNYYDGNGDITYFHDFVEVTSSTGETWEVTAVSAQAYSDNGITNIVIGDVLTETSPGSGIYRIDLFHPPGVGFTMTVDRTAGGGPFPLMEGGTCAACQQVPTLGQWGLILLSLLILTFGVVALRNRQMVLAGAGTSSFPTGIRQMPFDGASFRRMLVVVMVGLAVVFATAIGFFGYEMTTADVPGSLVAGPMLAYLLHLLVKKD